MSPAAIHQRDLEAAAYVLEKAGRRVAGNWARTGLARTQRGRTCASVDGRAVRWSLLGAIHLELERRGYGRHKEDRVYGLIFEGLEAVRPGWRVWHEQPGRKGREVAALALRASKRLRKVSDG